MTAPVRILGVNAFHADAAAALLVDGALVAAVEEERFTRTKHWAGFPRAAIEYCIAEGGGRVDLFAVARRPELHLWRKAALALARPRSLPRAVRRVGNAADVGALTRRLQAELALESLPRVHRVEHHLAHVASAFFCSPFEEAACLSVDGFGDFTSTLLAAGRGTALRSLARVHYPHSLGIFYTALTQYLGFPHYGDEYKVMGLAASGDASLVERVRRLVPGRDDGTFRLDLRFFRHLDEGVDLSWPDGAPRVGLLFTPALEALLGPARREGEPITDHHRAVAAAAQAVYEERLLALVRALLPAAGSTRLALAGGCAFNSVANGRLLVDGGVSELYVQPAAGDAGTALGAALHAWHCGLGRPRSPAMTHAFWGPAAGPGAVRDALAALVPGSGGRDGRHGAITIATVADPTARARETAAAIARGEVVGFYQGRAEWGPRALGARSILADPRRGDMRDVLNLKVKRRESFRPLAPAVLAEHAGEWLVTDRLDPFMTTVCAVREHKRALVPAITHVDGTARPQTVTRGENPALWAVLEAFAYATGVPMVLNTSFNESEPIVNTPREALACFLRTAMDRLVLEDVMVTRDSAAR